MRLKTIFTKPRNPCIVTLTFDLFDPKANRAYTLLMGRLHVKFHEDRCKGEAFMRLKTILPNRASTDGQTDGRTDGQGDSSIPP